MISGEDESSSVLNGRLRPRKSTANIPNTPNKSTYKPENQVAQDKLKRNSIPSKASPNKQDDLTAKADSPHLTQLLCPYCDRKFTTKLSASKHARRIHLSSSKQDNFIKCLFCNHSEAVASNIIRHMVDSHPNQYFACLDCNTRFFSTPELAEHKLNICEKQKQAYRSKLRQKAPFASNKYPKKIDTVDKKQYGGENKELKHEPEFNGVVISCELKPSHGGDAIDIEDNITTNLILPSNIGNDVLEKNAVIILDDMQWKRRIPPNFSFRNADADQILSRLGVVHRSPRVGESTRREWLKMIDVTNQKFEKCFDTNFYSRVASNVQQNLARFLDGSFNFSPDPDKIIKTRKTKSSAIINTAEGFPILLPHEQYSRNRFDGYMPRAIAPKHKWKWDSTENEKTIIFDASVMKRDSHVDNCIITLVSSLDMWTQLRMRRKFEGIFCKEATEITEKQNIIGRELKEILESREIPSTSSQVVNYTSNTADSTTTATATASDFPSFLGLSARASGLGETMEPAVLSGEWVRPRCYVCCACGDQTRDARILTAHMAAHHPNAQVQHYDIVGESLLNADILKHLYVPPSQMSNRTRPLRGFRDCTKCKKSITMEDLHQHMLDCAGDTPTVRRKCRSRPFGVRRRRPRLTDNNLRKNMRKDLRTRHNQKALLRARPRIRTEVGDGETIRKMIADLPAKRHRQAAGNLNTQQVRPRRKLDQQRNKFKVKRLKSKDSKSRKIQTKKDVVDSAIIDEDDQPLKPKSKIESQKKAPAKKRASSRVAASKIKKRSPDDKEDQHDSPTDDAIASRPQQISSENTTQRLNSPARENSDEAKEEGRSRSDENSPDEKRDKDIHISAVSDATLLKHSINNITALNKASQLQQQCQQSSESTLRDTSLPEKPIQDQKRCSQKKRESLLNCIEKIKSHQKRETMIRGTQRSLYEKRQRKPAREMRSRLVDPYPAVINRTHDESRAANNEVPDRIAGFQNIASALYPVNRDPNYRWGSRVATPQPQYVHQNSGLASPGTTALPMLYSPFDPFFYQMYNASVAHLQQQLEPYPRMPNPEHILHHQAEAYKNSLPAQYINQNYAVPGQCNTSDVHSDLLKNNISLPNETAPPLVGIDLQSPNMSHSPQSWKNESVPLTQALPRMFHSRPVKRRKVQRESRKTYYESFAPYIYPNRQYKEKNSGMLNHANMCSMPPETDDTNGSINISHFQNDVLRSKSQINTNCNNNDDCTTFTPERNDGYFKIPCVKEKEAEHYRTTESQTTTNVDNQYFLPPLETEENPCTPEFENYCEDSDIVIDETTDVRNTTDPSNMIPDPSFGDHPLLSPPSVQQTDETTPPLNESTIRDTYACDQACDLPLSADIAIYEQNHNTYCEDHQETSENNIYSGSAEEPLDLSVKQLQALYNDNDMSNARIENNQIQSNINNESLDLTREGSGRVYSNLEEVEINSTEYNATSSQSINTVSNEYINEQQVMAPHQNVIDQNCAVQNIIRRSCLRSTVANYEGISEVENISHQNNNKDCDMDLIKWNGIDQYKLDSQVLEESVSINSNHCLKDNVDLQVRSDKANEAGNGITETSDVIIMQSNNISYNTESLQKVDHDSPNKPAQHTYHLRTTAEQNMAQKDLLCLEQTFLQNLTSYETYADKTDDDENTSSFVFNAEDAKKILMLYNDGSDFLKEFNAIQQAKIVEVIYRMISPNVELKSINKLLENFKETIKKLHAQEISDMNILTAENSLTINTAALPSSSILPKKRHSPSTRLNSENAIHNTNQTLLKPSNISIQQSFTTDSVSGELTNKTSSANDLAVDPSSSDKKKKVESYECEAITHINKIIDLTDDNFGHSETKYNTPHLNAMFIQETNHEQQTTLKNATVNSELAVGPSSGDKKKQVEHNECEANTHINKIIDLTDDNLDHSNSKYNTPHSNAMLIQETNHKLQTTLKNANEQTASLRAVRIKTSLSRKSISDDKQITNKEVNNHQSICIDSQPRDPNISQVSNSEYSYGELAIDSASAQIPGHHANSIIKQPETRTFENLLASETSNLICRVEYEHKAHLEIATNCCVEKDGINARRGNTVIKQLLSDNYVNQKNITAPDNEFDKNADMINAEAVPQKSNEINIFLENIVNDNDQWQASSLGYEARRTTVINKNNVSMQPKNKIEVNTKKRASKNILRSNDSLCLTVTSPFNNTDSEEDSMMTELKIDESRNKNEYDLKQEDCKTYNDFKKKETMATTDNLSKRAIQSSQPTGLENSEHTPVPKRLDVENVNNENPSPQRNTTEDFNVEFSQSHLVKDSSKDVLKPKEIDKDKPRTMQAIKTIKEAIIHINCNEIPINCNEIQTDSYQGANSAQSFNANKEHGTYSDENTIEKLITPTVSQSHLDGTHALNAVNHGAKKVEYSQTIQSICLIDSDMSSNLEEASERALRRSRRGKSIDLDAANDPNTMSAVEINEDVCNKLPVTKKQLIFSKLMLDENLYSQIDRAVQTDASIETIILPAKHKKCRGLRKSKKNRLSTLKNEECTDKNEINFTSDSNNKTTTDKETSHLNYSKEKNILDSETMGNKNLFQLKEHETAALFKEDCSLAKRSKMNNKNVKTLKPQDEIAKDLINQFDLVIKDTDSNRKESRPVKTNKMTADNQDAGPSGYNGFKIQPVTNNSCVEIKTACYNRPILTKQLMSTTVAVKNPENYDPYDIDLELDMAETTKPIAKRKTNKSVSGSLKTLKKCSNEKNLLKAEIEKLANTATDISPPNVSDSDCDEPLQKYVEEKEKLKNEGLKSYNCNISEPNFISFTPTDTSKDPIDLSELESSLSIKNINKNDDTGSLTSFRDDENYITSDTADINQVVNQIQNTIELSTIKPKIIKRKNCQSTTSNKSPVTSEINQQLTPEKHLENFGFYAVKQPRKSNLLAAKKISETFHSMIESDDSYFRSKHRQRKSSQSENKKTADGNYTAKATQDATRVYSDRKSSLTLAQSTLQEDWTSSAARKTPIVSAKAQEAGTSGTARKSPIASGKETPETGTARKSSIVLAQSIAQRETMNSNIVDEPNNEGEVDLITAQRMLNSEEIRKLERDLYSGFKEAAEANAGKTFGFNQLRVEETGPRESTYKNVLIPQVELDTNKIPVKSENTKMSDIPEQLKDKPENTKISDIPEELEDKPLMYPENKVNMFEDKYDIIKRRREARDRAKQAELAKKAELAEIPSASKIEKPKRKPDRKRNKKNAKKPSYQGSPVPTKGALKGFDGIKISIPTQDLNMPPNVTPPNYRQRQGRPKKLKESSTKTRTESVSSYKSDSDADSKKITSTPDIYEFQDEERPVTKGYRLTSEIDKHRSSCSGNEGRAVTTNRVEEAKKKRKHNKDDCVSDDDHQNDRLQIKKWKGKGKGKHSDYETNKETEKVNISLNESSSIGKKSDKSKMNQKMDYLNMFSESADEDNDKLYNGYNNTLRSPQSIVEPFSDSDTEDQNVMPGTSGFVPDRNDESSYESDSSSPTPLISALKESYTCTCLKENNSYDKFTKKGCSHNFCRYNHLNAAKIAVMGKIFKNNALRCDKSDDSLKEVRDPQGPKPKQDMDKLFDSLLANTDIGASTPGPSSATYINRVNTHSIERDVSNVDDGFSSPNHSDSGKTTKSVSKSLSPTSPNKAAMVETSDESMEGEALAESVQSKHDKKYKISKNNTSEKQESSGSHKLKHRRHGKTNRDSQSKRSAPLSDDEIFSYEDEMSVAKLRRIKRRANKKHKSHHKSHKESEDVKSNKQKKITASSKRNSTTNNEENKRRPKKNRQSDEKLSPSRKSDEGISTSHDSSADACDMAPAEHTGVAIQRARRKCTVGKQNVLVEHWSSSESEDEGKGKKTSAKNAGRAAKNERTSRRSREFDSDGSDEVTASRAPVPRARVRAACAADRDDGFDVERYLDEIKKKKKRGWVVGDSCKKMLEILVGNKIKAEQLKNEQLKNEQLKIEQLKNEQVKNEKEKDDDKNKYEDKGKNENKDEKEDKNKKEGKGEDEDENNKNTDKDKNEDEEEDEAGKEKKEEEGEEKEDEEDEEKEEKHGQQKKK